MIAFLLKQTRIVLVVFNKNLAKEDLKWLELSAARQEITLLQQPFIYRLL